ncbi:hypothetical protein AGMMS49928_22850 [Spirochaetia bacterium]|nr:hypothetical protein AGMMS49928_22850 [Spirochaetia bacterium]
MKRKLRMQVGAAALAIGLVLAACPTDGVNGDKPINEGSPRDFLSNQAPSPITTPALLYAYIDPTTKNAIGVYKVGSIANQIITYKTPFYFNGYDGQTRTWTLTNTTERAISSTVANSVEIEVSGSTTVKYTVGAEAGFDVDMLKMKVKKETELSATLGISLKIFESYSSTTSVKETVSDSEAYTVKLDGWKPGYYIYGSFGFVDYFVEVTVNTETGKETERQLYHGIKPTGITTALEFSETYPINNNGDLAIESAKKLKIDFPVDAAALITEAKKQVIGGTGLPIDKWGEKLSYSYTVISKGDLRYTLVGGGAGGAGAAAVRDASFWLWETTEADAGWSADGGPTVLKLNGIEVAKAAGGAKVNGPDLKVHGKEMYENGVKGNNGQTTTGVLTVIPGDVITIEVGWGGGGSGGAAANDTRGYTSSGSADRTLGSEGKSAQDPGKTSAAASRGGVGGMHSLIFPSSQYTSNLQKGSSSPAASGAAAAMGGQEKGQGGAAGDELATGGMYASGGGGGAAGGFTLTGTVTVKEN